MVGFGGLLFVFQFLFVLAAATFQRSQAFEQVAGLVPAFLREAFGPSILPVLSYRGFVCLGYFHPFVIAALIGMTIAVATEPAAEVERRFVDLALARPVTRGAVITRTAVLLLGSTSVLLGSMLFGTWLGLRVFTPSGAQPPSAALVAGLAINLAALMMCWGGLALALAARARRRAVTGTVTGGLAFTAYLVDYLARVWEPAARLAPLSPFHYYDPMRRLLGSPLEAAPILTLAGAALVAGALAYVVYERRDL